MIFVAWALLALMIYSVYSAKVCQKDIFRIEWSAIASFLAIMFTLTLARVLIAHSTGSVDSLPPEIELSSLKWVWWEDLAFALPIFMLKDVKKLSKKIWIPFAVALSLLFGSGHLYQGVVGGIVTSFVPYFVFYRVGKKHGFGTSMLGHVLYDHILFFIPKITVLLLN